MSDFSAQCLCEYADWARTVLAERADDCPVHVDTEETLEPASDLLTDAEDTAAYAVFAALRSLYRVTGQTEDDAYWAVQRVMIRLPYVGTRITQLDTAAWLARAKESDDTV